MNEAERIRESSDMVFNKMYLIGQIAFAAVVVMLFIVTPLALFGVFTPVESGHGVLTVTQCEVITGPRVVFQDVSRGDLVFRVDGDQCAILAQYVGSDFSYTYRGNLLLSFQRVTP